MATPENTFIASVHKHLPLTVYHEKMHNPYRGGTPDVWYSGHARDLWVEYKFIVVPTRSMTMIDLCGGKDPAISHLQQEWLKARHSEGRNVAVIVGCRAGGVVFHSATWINAFTTEQFRQAMMARSLIANRILECVS